MPKDKQIIPISYDDVVKMAISLKEETYSSPLDSEIADFIGDPTATEVLFKNGIFQTNNGVPIESSVWHNFDPAIMACAAGGDVPLPRDGLEELLGSYGLKKGEYVIKGTNIDLGKRLSKAEFENLEKELGTYSIKNGKSLGYKIAAGGALAMLGAAVGAAVLAGCVDEKKVDSDSDGINDFAEKETYKTDPKNSDSDKDGLIDGLEVNQHHTDPLKSDSDGDGLKDGPEVNQYHSNPLKKDSDGDNFSDSFEINVAKLDPNVKNDRYVLISSRNYDHEKKGSKYLAAAVQVPDMYDFLLTSGNIPKENIIYLQKPSFTEFKNAVYEIAKKADGNDIVYIELHGETKETIDRFGRALSHEYVFSDTDASPYQVGNVLDNIHAKSTVITTELCEAGQYLDSFSDAGRVVITGSDSNQISPNADVGMYFFESMGHDVGNNFYNHFFLDKSPDVDGNGYVSVKEAYDIVKAKMAKLKDPENGFMPNNALFRDPSGIAGGIYLIEYRLPADYKV